MGIKGVHSRHNKTDIFFKGLLLVASKRHTLNNPARSVGIISNIETAPWMDALSKENF
jgi:hypothetical protein